jgi:hypothetical protein
LDKINVFSLLELETMSTLCSILQQIKKLIHYLFFKQFVPCVRMMPIDLLHLPRRAVISRYIPRRALGMVIDLPA